MTSSPRTLTEAAAALRAGETTSVALTEAALAAADAHDEQTGTYLARFDDYALASAHAADTDFGNGVDRGPLQGIPFGVKDIIAMAEGPTTAQSLVLDRTWGAGRDAPVVARLKTAGAVITGKTSTMEFAVGMPDDSKPFPIPRNPWDTDTWPGGSSSGTGSGVAAGLFFAGLGTDTGGSIRIPAAFCGVTGLMPTFGRVPKSGCVPLGYSLDHIGPLARSASDCAAVLATIAGHHPSDPDSVSAPFRVPEDLGKADLAGLRVGVVRDEHHFPDNGDPALLDTFSAAVAVLAELGATVVEVRLPYWSQMCTANMLTLACEALAYHRSDATERWTDFFAGTRAILAQGAMVSGADYVQAQRMRRVAQDAIDRMFDDVDVIACPTASITAPPVRDYLGERGSTGVLSLFASVHTGYWDCLGNPVLAMPMGFGANGLPLSVQLAGRAFTEATILRTADAFQQVTDWHLATPPLIAAATATTAAA
ncbi:MAG TPA: amidase [Pseudonocardiaceae bacterium]|jgi:aspartyl-tRNA(Asn)/glutamyl-tRNA(Gln) amidotransferase subunit A